MNYQVIIPAAGIGKRMGAGMNKLLLELNKRPIIQHTLDVFAYDSNCEQILLAIHPNDETYFLNLLSSNQYYQKVHLIYGGEERQYSVFNCLQELKTDGIVLVHDGARPFIRQATIQALVQSASSFGAAIAAVPVKDTIKKVTNFEVDETVDRTSLWQVQTPQAFRFSVLYSAHEIAKEAEFLGTDEASLVERMDVPVKVVNGDYDNIKITTPEDLYFAEAILAKRKGRTFNGGETTCGE